MSHAPCGKRFSDRSKEKRLGACMPEAGFLILPMKISPVCQIFLFVKLTIRFIIFYN